MKLKRTPLFEVHRRLGGRLVEFGGWEMPVQYTSIVEEHLAVRQAAGIFDISHMGEIQIVGSGAERFLNTVLTNNVSKLHIGQGQYTLMCNPQGGVVDDLYVFRIDDEEYLMIVNASRIEADWDWLQGQLDATQIKEVIRINNVSPAFGAVAVQGPRVADFINEVVTGGALRGTLVNQITDLKKNLISIFLYSGISIFVSRTGYTGEDGFEILAPAESIVSIWDRLLALGEQAGLRPTGLGARDTLRTEMGYPLFGQELNEKTTPIEAGLGFFVDLDKPDFVGKSVMVSQKVGDLARKSIGFKLTAKGPPPRPHYAIWSSGETSHKIGDVTSGTQSPSVGSGIGLGYVNPQFSKPGTMIEIEIRGRRIPAEVVKKPIYRPAR